MAEGNPEEEARALKALARPNVWSSDEAANGKAHYNVSTCLLSDESAVVGNVSLLLISAVVRQTLRVCDGEGALQQQEGAIPIMQPLCTTPSRAAG